MNLVRKWQSFGPQLLSILRIMAAGVFMLSGTLKLFSFPVAIPGFALPSAFTELWLAGVIEFIFGAFLLLGLFTRTAAFIAAGEMAVAYWQVQFPQGFWPMLNGGMPALLLCFIWLYISTEGGGPWSLDERKIKKSLGVQQ